MFKRKNNKVSAIESLSSLNHENDERESFLRTVPPVDEKEENPNVTHVIHYNNDNPHNRSHSRSNTVIRYPQSAVEESFRASSIPENEHSNYPKNDHHPSQFPSEIDSYLQSYRRKKYSLSLFDKFWKIIRKYSPDYPFNGFWTENIILILFVEYFQVLSLIWAAPFQWPSRYLVFSEPFEFYELYSMNYKSHNFNDFYYVIEFYTNSKFMETLHTLIYVRNSPSTYTSTKWIQVAISGLASRKHNVSPLASHLTNIDGRNVSTTSEFYVYLGFSLFLPILFYSLWKILIYLDNQDKWWSFMLEKLLYFINRLCWIPLCYHAIIIGACDNRGGPYHRCYEFSFRCTSKDESFLFGSCLIQPLLSLAVLIAVLIFFILWDTIRIFNFHFLFSTDEERHDNFIESIEMEHEFNLTNKFQRYKYYQILPFRSKSRLTFYFLVITNIHKLVLVLIFTAFRIDNLRQLEWGFVSERNSNVALVALGWMMLPMVVYILIPPFRSRSSNIVYQILGWTHVINVVLGYLKIRRTRMAFFVDTNFEIVLISVNVFSVALCLILIIFWRLFPGVFQWFVRHRDFIEMRYQLQIEIRAVRDSFDLFYHSLEVHPQFVRLDLIEQNLNELAQTHDRLSKLHGNTFPILFSMRDAVYKTNELIALIEDEIEILEGKSEKVERETTGSDHNDYELSDNQNQEIETESLILSVDNDVIKTQQQIRNATIPELSKFLSNKYKYYLQSEYKSDTKDLSKNENSSVAEKRVPAEYVEAVENIDVWREIFHIEFGNILDPESCMYWIPHWEVTTQRLTFDIDDSLWRNHTESKRTETEFTSRDESQDNNSNANDNQSHLNNDNEDRLVSARTGESHIIEVEPPDNDSSHNRREENVLLNPVDNISASSSDRSQEPLLSTYEKTSSMDSSSFLTPNGKEKARPKRNVNDSIAKESESESDHNLSNRNKEADMEVIEKDSDQDLSASSISDASSSKPLLE